MKATWITRSRILIAALVGFTLFTLGGGLDFTRALFYGGNIPMQNGKMSAFSPVAIMLYFFGALGIYFIHHGTSIIHTDIKLGKKQIEAGFILIYFDIPLLELLYWFCGLI